VDLELLRQELGRSRTLKNRVLKSWLQEDPRAVATLVRVFGAEITADLRADRELRLALDTVSQEVAHAVGPVEDAEVEQVGRALAARLEAARVVHDGDDLTRHWEFLEGMSLANLPYVLDGLSVRERAHVVARMPETLRAAYLQSVDDAARRELFLTADGALPTKQEVIDLASRVRRMADDLSHVGAEAEAQSALALDMLRALAPAQQEAVLRDLRAQRPEVARGVLSRLLLDSAFPLVPEAVLTDVIARTPLAELVGFLTGTSEAVRAHVLHAAPTSRRRALETELSLDAPLDRELGRKSREAVMTAVLKTLAREGVDPARLNTQALLQAGPVHKVSDGKAIA
jgi:flagellar motor switch protein FliG